MSQAEASPAFGGYGSKGYRAYVLGALLVIYVFNVVDRIILAILQERIRVDLQLTDLQLGILGGPAFVLVYTLLGIPIARYAERANRITIVAIGAALWSAATTACGFAQNYAQLILGRIGVGIGEAACMPPSHSAISDYFPSDKRASALAVYGLGIPIGTLLAAFGGGYVVQNLDWRSAFWILGAPGILAAILLKLTVKEPLRPASHARAPGLGDTLRALASKQSFWHVTIGGALVALFTFSLTHFFVSYFIRQFGVQVSTASTAFGIVNGFSAAIGIFAGGFLCDQLTRRHPRVLSWLPALGAILSVPLYFTALLQNSFSIALFFMALAPMLHFLTYAPMFAVAQAVAEPRMRATACALLLTIVTLVGYGLGPPLAGALADHFNALRLAELGLSLQECMADQRPGACESIGAHGLRVGLICTLIFLAWASLHYWLAGRTLVRDRFD